MNRAVVLCGLVAALGLPACSPTIGSSCVQSTDCSVKGDRACDTSQPEGYCTVFGCGDQTCPNSAACVAFNVALPGCSYNDYQAPARTSRTLCLAHCQQDSDCRTSEGYVCADPKGAPWSARIVDDNQTQLVCIVAATPIDAGFGGPEGGAALCNAGRPLSDGAVSATDAGAADAADSE